MLNLGVIILVLFFVAHLGRKSSDRQAREEGQPLLVMLDMVDVGMDRSEVQTLLETVMPENFQLRSESNMDMIEAPFIHDAQNWVLYLDYDPEDRLSKASIRTLNGERPLTNPLDKAMPQPTHPDSTSTLQTVEQSEAAKGATTP